MSEERKFKLQLMGETNWISVDKLVTEIIKLGYRVKLDSMGNIWIYKYIEKKVKK